MAHSFYGIPITLAVAGMVALNTAASRWDVGVRGTLTIQIVPTDDAGRDEGD